MQQTFKEIPYQNYIELRFNQKNLNQLSHQQALIKYKRNAQVLAQIFAFQRKPLPDFPSDNSIPEQKLKDFQRQIQQGQQETQQRIARIEKDTEKFQQCLQKTKQIETIQQLQAFVEELKQNEMHDDSHPFFIEGSPFYLNSAEDDCLQVKDMRNVERDLLQNPDILDIN